MLEPEDGLVSADDQPSKRGQALAHVAVGMTPGTTTHGLPNFPR